MLWSKLINTLISQQNHDRSAPNLRTGLVFPNWSKWVQGVLCYDQNWWKLKYLSRISIDIHWQFFLSFSTSSKHFTLKWVKVTHNGKFCQKSGLDWLQMANFGHFAGFSIFSPKIRLRLTWNGQFHLIHNFSRLFATKASHFWESQKSLFFLQIFWVSQLFQIVSHQRGSKWSTMANFAKKVA